MKMFALDGQNARFSSFNPRPEKHGDDNVPASDLQFQTIVPGITLNLFENKLREAFYRKMKADETAGDLMDQAETPPDGLVKLKFTQMGDILWKREYPGYKCNLQTRLDGLPRSDQKAPVDPGVAVYWQRNGEAPKVMAIDQYTTVADNIAAIAATLDAMRAIERHGGAQILDRAFTGFEALPAPGQSKSWRDILDVPDDMRPADSQLARAKNHYRALASANHPDKGGSTERMAEINRAWQQACEELGNG